MGYMKFPTLGNRKVPKLAGLHRTFPASIQLTTSSIGVKDRGQSRLYGGPQLSRQKQKPHGKNKIPHGKTENLKAKTKYLTANPKTSRQKQNTSQQNQNPHGKNQILHSNTSLYFSSVYDVTDSLKKSFV